MIGLLKGTVAYKENSYLILDVRDVGYKVLVASSLLESCSLGDGLTLHIYTHVREDVLDLFGFTQPQDLKLFEYLISVSGVGCKTALNVFTVGSRKEIIKAIVSNDVSFFTAVPRLGKKNAQKIIIELKSKLGDGTDFDFASDGADHSEVIDALKSFGFSAAESREALRHVKGETVEEKIRLALKHLGK